MIDIWDIRWLTDYIHTLSWNEGSNKKNDERIWKAIIPFFFKMGIALDVVPGTYGLEEYRQHTSF